MDLPPSTRIHPIFHVSYLNKKEGAQRPSLACEQWDYSRVKRYSGLHGPKVRELTTYEGAYQMGRNEVGGEEIPGRAYGSSNNDIPTLSPRCYKGGGIVMVLELGIKKGGKWLGDFQTLRVEGSYWVANNVMGCVGWYDAILGRSIAWRMGTNAMPFEFSYWSYVFHM